MRAEKLLLPCSHTPHAFGLCAMIAWVACCFVVMGLLYHGFAHGQQVFKIFTRCLPYEYLRSQTGGGL